MKRYIIFIAVLGVVSFMTNAQTAHDGSLSRLKTQCNKVVELENSIATKQANLNEINNSINNLRQLWMEICMDFFNDPNSTAEDFADLLAETDTNEERELYKDLEWAKDHPSMNERRSRPHNESETKALNSPNKSNKDVGGSDGKGANTQPKGQDANKKKVDPEEVIVKDPKPIEPEPKTEPKANKEDKKVEEPQKTESPVKKEVPVKVENPDKKKEDITKKTEESSGQDKDSIVRNRRNKTGNPK